ncbi:MAG: ComF family protein [Armatimonadetes bacterium]|nr:ComF family protein [Armatimonadota bacterium]
MAGEICARCGRPEASRRCPDCGEAPWASARPCDSLRQTAIFEGALRRAIHRYKYDGMKCLADPLGEMLTAWLEGSSAKWREFDAVVAVPGSRARGWELGFHHSHELALRVARFLELPLLQPLRRLRGPGQMGLSRQQRLENAHRIYGARRNPPDIRGMRILLVDDVVTTGATADALAAKLKALEASSVRMLALARTVELS